MRVPQVSERIKEAPAQALRGVFAGIGQLLLITDKLRNKASHQEMTWARTPGAPAADTDTTVTSPPAPAETVAAKPAPAEPAASRPATARRPAAKPAAGKPVTPKPGAKPVTAKPPTARRPAARPAPPAPPAPAELAGQTPPKPQSTRDFDKTGNVRLLDGEKGSSAGGAPATGEPPLPNYDELSVASLRARLRNLDVAQVRQLAEYERAHAARAEVLTMFERRVAKLEAEA